MKCTFKANSCVDKKTDGSCGWSFEGKDGHHCSYAEQLTVVSKNPTEK
jgi:hypothetical protein